MSSWRLDGVMGGLLVHEGLVSTAPAAPGRLPVVSHLGRALVGDDQGREGACAIFAMASWAECVLGSAISNQRCITVYKDALRRAGRTGGGLYFEEAFSACVTAGIVPPGSTMHEASLSDLSGQPLVAGYVMTRAFDNVAPNGCLDHAMPMAAERGYHAVCVVASGPVGSSGEDYVWIENSWGLGWGWRGIGFMQYGIHRLLCRQLFRIELP